MFRRFILASSSIGVFLINGFRNDSKKGGFLHHIPWSSESQKNIMHVRRISGKDRGFWTPDQADFSCCAKEALEGPV